MRKAKYIIQHWPTIAAADEEEPEMCITLRRGESMALASMLEYLRWRTRWQDAPPDDDLQRWVDDLESRLTVSCGCFECARITECIDDDQSVREALERWFDSSQYAAELRRRSELLGGIGYNIGGGACDEDMLYGQIRALFDELYQSGQDFYEILDASAQVTELFAEFGEYAVGATLTSGGSSAVVLGVLTVVGEVTEQFIRDVSQAYASAYTTEVRDALACEFFCLVRSNCTFTIADVLQWLRSKTAYTGIDIGALFEFVFTAGGLSALPVLSTWLLELSLYEYGVSNRLGNILSGGGAVDALARMARVIAAADADDSWLFLCDTCNEQWEYVIDFSSAAGNWRGVDNTRAQYIGGAGWRRSSAPLINGTRLEIETLHDVNSTIVYVAVEFTRQDVVMASGGVGYLSVSPFYAFSSAGSPIQDFSVSAVYTNSGRFQIRIANSAANTFPSSAALPADLYIRRVTIRGIGDNPFE